MMQDLYSALLTKYLNTFLIILLGILITFSINSRNFQLDASSDSLILDDDKDLEKYREIVNNYSSKDFLILTLTNNNKIVTKENIKFIKTITSEIKNLEWVDSVQSILDVPLLSVNNQNLSDLVNEILTIESSNINLTDAENEILESPIFKNLILSEDATTTGIIVYFKRNNDYENLINERDNFKNKETLTSSEKSKKLIIENKYQKLKKLVDADRHQNIIEIRSIIKNYETFNNKIHLGGVSMIADDTISFVKNDILIFGLGALIFILLVLYLIFRNFTWMLVSIANCAYCLIVMVGAVALLNWKATVISSNFIMLMMILSLSMTIHIVVRYRQFMNDYADLKNIEILIKCLEKMYKPCLFSALTTIFAFATLYTSEIKPVMDFGLMMCVGLTVTYLTSFTFLPAIISKFNLKKLEFSENQSDKNIFLILISRFSRSIVITFALILFIGLYGTTTLKVENSFVDYFKKDTEIYKGMKLIDEKLGGTTPLDIIIQFEETLVEEEEEDFLDFGIEYNPADYWFNKEKMNTIKAIHDHLEEYEFSGKVLSLASLIRAAEKLNEGKEFDTLELAVLYKKLPNDLKEQILSPYVSIDQNQARITMRIVDTHKNLRRNEFINQLNTHLKENYSDLNISVSGILILYNNMLQSLFDSQIKSLAIVMAGIFIMLLILFRSFTIAVITIAPNIIACFAILGIMGIIAIPLDLMTITIAAITIGIAVDNCIHYVYRYQEYYSETKDHLETVKMCQNSVGRAIQNTSVTIIVGFSILVFSNFFPTIYFGIFTALAMFIALVGSLTLLPILLQFKKA
tara:strand:- start:2124 stop:4541 length:2418 start_codon:yes stop_codon:yes gene_type:complete